MNVGEVPEGVYLDGIVSIPTGDPVVDALYNMERARRDYTLPIHFTLGGSQVNRDGPAC